MAIVVQFGDDDVAAGVARGELSLIGRLFGSPPPLYALKSMLGRVWHFIGGLTISSVEEGLTHFLFSQQADLRKAVNKSPWIFDNFMIVLARWANPSPDVADQLRRAPMAVHIWQVPFDCFTEKMAMRLGSSLGTLIAPPSLHRSDVSGGLYIRAEPVLDLTAPLPVEITAGHVDSLKGNFVAKVKFERVIHFCFLCGVIGHIGEGCPQKEEFAGKPPRYGFFSVETESGPPISEATLSNRRRRFTWIRAAAKRPAKPRSGGSFKEPAPCLDPTRLLTAQEVGAGNVWQDTRRPRSTAMGDRLQGLSLHSAMEDESDPASMSPTAKRSRSSQVVATNSEDNGKVAVSSLN
ncbi:unnamed protein product [Linum trigynum]